LARCKECGREFKSEAALKDHRKDAHRERLYQHKSSFRIWVLAIFVLIVICVAGFVAYRGNLGGTSQTGLTASSASSNVIWNNQIVNVTEGGYISAVLNPVGRIGYKAQGHVVLEGCPVLLNEIMCPEFGMWVVNKTELAQLESPNMPPPRAYNMVRMSAKLGNSTEFVLDDLDYNGEYYFVFISFQNQPLLTGQHAVISISLTETWTEN
jgi:hypothetical protein